MRTIGLIIGFLMSLISGILMFIFWYIALTKWLGFIGGVLAFILTPGLVIFPIVFWIVEGVFPTFYFILWAIGTVGIIIVGLSGVNE